MAGDENQAPRRATWDAITGESSDQERRAAVREVLEKIPLFSGLDGHHLEELAQLAQTSQVNPGVELVREGEEGRALVVLATGSARVERHGRVIAQMESGEHLGEISLIDGQPRAATVITETPSTVVVLSRAAFQHLLQSSPGVKDTLLITLCSRLRQLQERLLD